MSVTDLLNPEPAIARPRDAARGPDGTRSFLLLALIARGARAEVLGTSPLDPVASDYDDDEDEDYFYDDDDEDEDDLDDDFDDDEEEDDEDDEEDEDEI